MKTKKVILIPCYNVEMQIEKVVLETLPYCETIILCNDKSTDSTLEIIEKMAKKFINVIVINHNINQGVGGAMISLFKKGLEIGGDYFIKMDGDGQMNPVFISELVSNIENGKNDFSKGNRFFDLTLANNMPLVRRMGNLFLSFMIKAASGYWFIFDPTNGYFCLTETLLKKINFDKLDNRYFFECSLIIHLNLLNAKVVDVPMPAIYGDEKSNLSISKTIVEFPPKLFKAFCKRILVRYFLYDFNIASLYLFFGLPMFLFGILYGSKNWIHYSKLKIETPTGTIIIALLTIMLGFQLLLNAIQYDIEHSSKR